VRRVRETGSIASAGAHDFAEEVATGELREIEVSGEAGMDGGAPALLRNIHVNADGIGLREREKSCWGGAAVAGVDQCSEIHVAAGDDAAEGSVNMLEGFQFGEAMGHWLAKKATPACFGGQNRRRRCPTSCLETAVGLESDLRSEWP